MKILQTVVTHTPGADRAIVVTALTECALGSRAAYTLDWTFHENDPIAEMADEAAKRGMKLTANEAEKIFGTIENYRR